MTARTAPVHTEKTMCRVSPTRMTPRVPSVSVYALFQARFADSPALLMMFIVTLPSYLIPCILETMRFALNGLFCHPV